MPWALFPFRYNEIHDKKKWGKVQSACQSKTWSKQRLFLLSYISFSITIWQMPSQVLSELCLRWWTKPRWAWFCSEFNECGWGHSRHSDFNACAWAHPWCSDVSACAHPWCSDLNACMWAHPDACISMRVCEHTHDTLILMCVSTPMMLWSQCVCVSTPMMLGSQCVCVWAHPWHSDLNITLKRELQMMLTDDSWSFSPTK